MKYLLFISIIFLSACKFNLNQFNIDLERAVEPTHVSKIAFGSCANQNEDQPILYQVIDTESDLFIYLGDNIYGDTENMKKLAEKYETLAEKEEFKELVKSTKTLAVWDDHDYGENDAGKYYPKKEMSKEIFLEFFDEPENSSRRNHEGIYHSKIYDGDNGYKIQIIMLDTRTFRSDLLKNDNQNGHKNDYRPNPNADSTFLGEAQWLWLEQQFSQTADIRIIASSNQFSHEYNGWESWTNVPKEQEKMLDLIKNTQANGVIFISGDVHWGEISKLEKEGQYPIYDVTSSGITETWSSIEPNSNRVGNPERDINFGLIEIDWNISDPIISLSIRNKNGIPTTTHQINLSEIHF